MQCHTIDTWFTELCYRAVTVGATASALGNYTRYYCVWTCAEVPPACNLDAFFPSRHFLFALSARVFAQSRCRGLTDSRVCLVSVPENVPYTLGLERVAQKIWQVIRCIPGSDWPQDR